MASCSRGSRPKGGKSAADSRNICGLSSERCGPAEGVLSGGISLREPRLDFLLHVLGPHLLMKNDARPSVRSETIARWSQHTVLHVFPEDWINLIDELAHKVRKRIPSLPRLHQEIRVADLYVVRRELR